MKRLTAITLLLAATVQTANAKPPKGYPDCPFDNVQDCALDASVGKFADSYRSGKYTRPDGTMDFDLMAKDAKKDHVREKTDAVQQRRDQQAQEELPHRIPDNYRESVKQAQHYLDHYEPHTECQQSQVMSAADMQNQWTGISSGPQGMDCQTVYVPVYR